MLQTERLGDTWVTVSDRLSPLMEGFREAYSCLSINGPKLESHDPVVSSFEGLELRVLVRSTATYAGLQLHLLHPEFLKDGIDRSIELEWLARLLTGTAAAPDGRIAVYERKRSAMEILDTPHFTTSTVPEIGSIRVDNDLSLLSRVRDAEVVRRRL